MNGRNKWICTLLLVLSAVCLAIGVVRGEAETVLTKAVYVFLECIGIG